MRDWQIIRGFPFFAREKHSFWFFSTSTIVQVEKIILHHIIINLAILISSLISRKIMSVDKIITYKFYSLFIYSHATRRTITVVF